MCHDSISTEFLTLVDRFVARHACGVHAVWPKYAPGSSTCLMCSNIAAVNNLHMFLGLMLRLLALIHSLIKRCVLIIIVPMQGP